VGLLEEAFGAIKPNFSHLKAIKCMACCHIPKEKRIKLKLKLFQQFLSGMTSLIEHIVAMTLLTKKCLSIEA
jgi:hypothetical protein